MRQKQSWFDLVLWWFFRSVMGMSEGGSRMAMRKLDRPVMGPSQYWSPPDPNDPNQANQGQNQPPPGQNQGPTP
jgi:hypothetical protein